MSEYSNEDFAKDFIKRTQYNLEQLKHGPYEVTQLVNSTVGLLMIPQEEFFDQITDDLIDPNILTRMRKAIRTNSYIDNKYDSSLKDIVIHIRNGFAHNNTKFHPKEINEKMEINQVTIWDYRRKTPTQEAATFKITLSISLLRKFLIEFSSKIIGIDKAN